MELTGTPVVYYGKPMLPSVMRVLACLYEKDVKFKHVDMGYQPFEFLQVQASRKIPSPCFEDEKTLLFESRAICRHIAEKYSERGHKHLLGRDLLDRASIEQWLKSEEQSFDPPTTSLIFNLALDPLKDAQKLARVLDVYDQRLSESKYLAGDDFTLADLSHIPNTHLLEYSQWSYLFESRKNVLRWWENISHRPSWIKVLQDYEKQCEEEEEMGLTTINLLPMKSTSKRPSTIVSQSLTSPTTATVAFYPETKASTETKDSFEKTSAEQTPVSDEKIRLTTAGQTALETPNRSLQSIVERKTPESSVARTNSGSVVPTNGAKVEPAPATQTQKQPASTPAAKTDSQPDDTAKDTAANSSKQTSIVEKSPEPVTSPLQSSVEQMSQQSLGTQSGPRRASGSIEQARGRVASDTQTEGQPASLTSAQYASPPYPQRRPSAPNVKVPEETSALSNPGSKPLGPEKGSTSNGDSTDKEMAQQVQPIDGSQPSASKQGPSVENEGETTLQSNSNLRVVDQDNQTNKVARVDEEISELNKQQQATESKSQTPSEGTMKQENQIDNASKQDTIANSQNRQEMQGKNEISSAPNAENSSPPESGSKEKRPS